MVTKVKGCTLQLTENEAYTLQILLGFVASDAECYSISEKLLNETGEEMGEYDFNRAQFLVEGFNTGKIVELEEDQSVVIRFN
jgi:hypothetical protein